MAAIVSFFIACIFLLAGAAQGQSAASLKTADTELTFEASASGPRLVSLRHGSDRVWSNRAPEKLIEAVEIDGKSVSLIWAFKPEATKVSGDSVSYYYESASPRLRLMWNWYARSARGPVEHDIQIENLGSQEIWIPLQESLVFDWEIAAQDSIEKFYVEKGADTPSAEGVHFNRVNDGDLWQGHSSTYSHPRNGETREIIPYLLVQRADENKSGWYVGIEFSGRVQLALKREPKSLSGAVGLNPEGGHFRTRLKPGDVFTTPRIFLGATAGGPDEAGNVLRPWVREVLGNQNAWNDPHYPLAVNNSWGSGMAVDEAMAKRMIRDSADLGLEMFHIDAGWFRGVGDWYPNEKFPHGLAVIADDAHTHGLRFGLWVDWTQAALDRQPGALDLRDPKVRKWMTKVPPASWQPEPFKGQTIDIGAPEAKAWAMKETDRIVSDYKLDMLEHDGYLVAQGCEATDHPHAPPDPYNYCTYKDWGSLWFDSSNSTDVSYHAVWAYYDIYSNLRKKHPGLLLEVCDDGGRMIDFGSAAHADYFSITDTYDPLSNRRAFYDTSYVLPPAMLEAYVERWPTPKIDNFRYMLRSGMMGWFTVMLDTSVWTEEQRRAAKEEIDLYKNTLRPFIRDAHLYHVAARPDGLRWDGMEYFNPEIGSGVVYAFRGSVEMESEHAFVLQGLKPEARYRVRFHDRSACDREVTGEELMTAGLRMKLGSPNSSEIVFLDEVAAH